MSHNLEQVGTATPDASSDLGVELNDLSDVSGVPSDGQALEYSGGAWGPGAWPTTQRRALLNWTLLSGSFSTSNYYYDVGDTVLMRNAQMSIYDSTRLTRVASSGSLVPVPTGSWSMYYTLKSSELEGKTLKLEAVHNGRYVTGSTEIVYQWGSSASTFGTFTALGPKARQNVNYNTRAFGYITVGSSDVNVALMVVAETGNVSVLTGTNGNYTSMHISVVGE